MPFLLRAQMQGVPIEERKTVPAATTSDDTLGTEVLDALQAHVMSSTVPSRRPIRCCLYAGSFDPFHLGHLEVVRVTLERNLADLVLVVPNCPNKSKPDRSDLDFRCHIVELSLTHASAGASAGASASASASASVAPPRVLVVQQHVDKLAACLDRCAAPRVELSVVMGSDQFHVLLSKNKRPHLHELVRHWFIVPRRRQQQQQQCAQPSFAPNVWGDQTKIHVLDGAWFCRQTGSSTDIRKAMRHQLGFAMGGDFVHDLVDAKIARLLVESQWYSRTRAVQLAVARALGAADVVAHVTLSLIKDERVLLATIAGAPASKWVVKCYDNGAEQMQACERELESYQWLADQQQVVVCKGTETKTETTTACCKIVGPTQALRVSTRDDDVCYLVTTFEGPTALQVILDAKDKVQLERAHEVGRLIGGSLRRLHETVGSSTSSERQKQHQLAAANGRWSRERLISKLLARNSDLAAKTADALVDAFEADPDPRGYIHGDASLSNFVLRTTTCGASGASGESHEVVVMIDCSGIAEFGALGVPAYEYYQMLSSIRWAFAESTSVGAAATVVAATSAGFSRGYKGSSRAGLPFTKASIALFSAMWCLAPDA